MKPSQIDWPVFLARYDMRFDKLPGSWRDAPHLGNAMIGSMLYQVNDALRLQVFRADVQDHRDESYGWTAYSRPRLIIGHFALHPVGKLTGCRWRKDLWNAELTGTIQTDRGTIGIRHFTHAVDMGIVTELTPSAGERGLKWTWHPAPAQTTRPGYPRNDAEMDGYANRYGQCHRGKLKPWTPNPEGRLQTRGDIHVWAQDLLVGGQYATAWAETRQDETRTLIVTIANTYPQATAADQAASDIARFIAQDRAGWTEAHRGWWHAYYPRSFVSIPDKHLESLYWRTVYRFGCTSRAGRFHVDTSGLWYQGNQWPYTTNDWNTQSAHWGVYAANRLEQGAEIVNRLHRYQQNLIDAVSPEAWREDSAYLTLATAGDLAGSRTGDMRYHDLVGCLPWLLHNAWWQYRFSMDDEMLRTTVFPLLRRAVNLYLHLVEEGEDGHLHLSPTYSPETDTFRDANFDLALFKWGCHILLRSCERLGIDDPLKLRWREVIDRLVDFPVDEHGFKLAADEPARSSHRHLSHLLMIYPLYLVNIEQGGAMDVLSRSYERVHLGAGDDDGAICELQAMVQTHAGPIGCALGRGDDALEGLRRAVGEYTPVGLWPCANNLCLESAVSVMSIIQDMLIQSWSDPAASEPGPIRIFPAVPSSWMDVTYYDLRAEGAFLVSARREAGRTRWVRIQSLAGEPCNVKPNFDGAFRVESDHTHTLVETSPGIYRIDLRAGESIELFATHDDLMEKP